MERSVLLLKTGCYFHLAQNLWKTSEKSLFYKTRPELRENLKRIKSLIFISPEDVIMPFISNASQSFGFVRTKPRRWIFFHRMS